MSSRTDSYGYSSILFPSSDQNDDSSSGSLTSQVSVFFFSFFFPSLLLRAVLSFQTPILFTDTFSGKGRPSFL